MMTFFGSTISPLKKHLQANITSFRLRAIQVNDFVAGVVSAWRMADAYNICSSAGRVDTSCPLGPGATRQTTFRARRVQIPQQPSERAGFAFVIACILEGLLLLQLYPPEPG